MFYIADSERATMTSWWRSIVIFHLGCMVSKIKWCYFKPDLTSSWFLRQVAFYAISRDKFWKSDHDILIAFYNNFLSAMYVFGDNEVLLQDGYDVIVFSRPGGASRNFTWRILKEPPWLPNIIHSNCLSVMHGFRDNEVLLQAGYDVIVISSPMVASRYFTYRLLKERPWLPDCVS